MVNIIMVNVMIVNLQVCLLGYVCFVLKFRAKKLFNRDISRQFDSYLMGEFRFLHSTRHLLKRLS